MLEELPIAINILAGEIVESLRMFCKKNVSMNFQCGSYSPWNTFFRINILNLYPIIDQDYLTKTKLVCSDF